MLIVCCLVASVLSAPSRVSRERRSLGLIKYGLSRGTGFLSGLQAGLASQASFSGLSNFGKIATGVGIPLGLLGKCKNVQ